MSVIGIDGCKRGWIAIALDDEQQHPRSVRERLDDLGAAMAGVHAVAIDIPDAAVPGLLRSNAPTGRTSAGAADRM